MRLFLIVLFVGLETGYCQVLKVSEAKHWRMYDPPIPPKQWYLDSVSNYSSMPLSDVVIDNYLAKVEVWPKDKWSYWQGYYLCSAEFPDSGRVVFMVSRFGGFFMM